MALQSQAPLRCGDWQVSVFAGGPTCFHKSCFLPALRRAPLATAGPIPKVGGVMKVHSLFGILLLALLPGVALAQAADFQLPEPGVLELLGLAAVAAVVVRIRNRRK